MLRHALAAWMVAASCAAAMAVPVTVPNHSFEDGTPVGDGGSVQYGVPDWSRGGNSLAHFRADPLDNAFPGATGGPLPSPADGPQYVGLYTANAPGAFGWVEPTSPLVASIIPDTDYELTVAVGNAANVQSEGDVDYVLQFVSNGTVIKATSPFSQNLVPDGSFVDRSLTVSASELTPGDPLSVRVGFNNTQPNGFGRTGLFDNVRLEALAAAPPPPPGTPIPIEIPNASFEVPIDTTETGVIYGVPGWSHTGTNLHVNNPGDSQYPGSSGSDLPSPGDGAQHMGFYSSNSGVPTTVFTYPTGFSVAGEAETDYLLQVAVGDTLSGLNNVEYFLEMLVNGAVVEQTAAVTLSEIPNGTFVDLSVELLAEQFSPGDAISFRLGINNLSGFGRTGHFDNVRLFRTQRPTDDPAAAIPEPASAALGLLGVGLLAVVRRWGRP